MYQEERDGEGDVPRTWEKSSSINMTSSWGSLVLSACRRGAFLREVERESLALVVGGGGVPLCITKDSSRKKKKTALSDQTQPPFSLPWRAGAQPNNRVLIPFETASVDCNCNSRQQRGHHNLPGAGGGQPARNQPGTRCSVGTQ